MTNQTTMPTKEFRIGVIKAAVWLHRRADGAPRFNTTFERLYKDGRDTWRSTHGFQHTDLPVVAEISARVHEWIREQMGSASREPGDGPGE